MTTTARRWAATGAVGVALLSGEWTCHAFLASCGVVVPLQQACRSSSFTTRSTAIMSADEVDLSPLAGGQAVVAEFDNDNASTTGPSTAAAGTQPEEGAAKDAAREAGRRWIKEMNAGDKVIGYVAGTTKFAAFVECGVVRRGAKDKIMPVTGFLHVSDVKPPYALEGTPLAKECDIEVKKGIHLTAYVKDVFPNAGRMTLSLDPSIDREKVLKLRKSKRQRSRTSRRERLHKKGAQPAVGDVVEGYIRRVQDSMLLVDVMFTQLSVLRASKIRNSGAEGKFVNLHEKAKPGDVITVRIDDIDTSKRRGAKSDKATIDFVGWGGLDANTNAPDGPDGSNSAAPSAAARSERRPSFDVAAEIDALPVTPKAVDAAPSVESDDAVAAAETAFEEER